MIQSGMQIIYPSNISPDMSSAIISGPYTRLEKEYSTVGV
jgi:hypothetical protein